MPAGPSIFITGAASGIGRATALHFARRNWFVGLFDTDAAGLEALAARLGARRCCLQAMDVTEPSAVQAATGYFARHTQGRMRVLFNCAGILQMGRHTGIGLAAQQRTVAVNLGGVLNCIHAALPLLQQTPGARIINMSSASAVYGVPELAVYSATKCAVRGLTEALNIELAPLGILVCDVMTPYVRTPMITEAAVQATSVQRLGVRLEPEQVAAVIWRAAHGRRVHWHMGGLLKLLLVVTWALPPARRGLVRALTFAR